MNYKIPLLIALVAGGISATMVLSAAKRSPNVAYENAPKALKKVPADVYMIYDGINPQNLLGSYQQTLDAPIPCGGEDALCYFVIPNDADNTVDASEFTAALAVLDTNSDGSLDDEAEQPGVLEKLTLSKAK